MEMIFLYDKNKKYQQFEDELTAFFNSDDRIALIRGFMDDDKLIGVLFGLQNNKLLKHGVIKVNSLQHFKELYLRALNRKLKIKLNENFNIGNLIVKVLLYSRNDTYSPYDSDFEIFYPVESALYSEKDTKRLKSHIKDSRAKKIIIVTTNDYSNKTDTLMDLVDKQLVLDSSTKYPDKYRILINNLKENGQMLPY